MFIPFVLCREHKTFFRCKREEGFECMNLQLFEDVSRRLNDVYKNLFFVALKNRRDTW